MKNQEVLLVNKSKFSDCAIQQMPIDTLKEGEVLLQIDKFALTSNNITYAVVGHQIGYWNFFPAEGDMGIIPVWGFATVVKTQHAEIKVGQRYYGYYPMASHLKVAPVKNSEHGFIDGVEHRRALPPVYNFYTRTTQDSLYSLETENLLCLLRPLFLTSFLIDDFFVDNDFFDSQQIILTSASSKTALALAHLMHHRKKEGNSKIQLIGLTSPRNKKFVEASGYYDKVLVYADYEQLDASVNSSIVEFAGNHQLQYQLQTHLTTSLKHNCLVGIVHWEAMRGKEKLPQKGTFFFAPTFAQEKQKLWGRAAFNSKLEGAWRQFIPHAADWLNVQELQGAERLKAIYLTMLAGDFDAKDGYVFSF